MPRHAHYLPHGVIPAVLAAVHAMTSPSTRRAFASICAMSRRPTAFRRSPSMPIRPRWRPAASTSSAACSTSRRTRSATGCRSSTASGPTAASRPRASPAWRRRAAPRRCWCSRRRRSRLRQSPAMAVEHFKRIADASSLPIIAFQYPLATGQGYPRDTLSEDGRGGADAPRHQGLGRQCAAARDADPRAAKPAAAGQRADHPQRLAA